MTDDQLQRDELTGCLTLQGASAAGFGYARDVLTRNTDSDFFAFLDIDGLLEFNNLWGIPNGDRVIVHVTRKLEQLFPNREIARVGGDDFLVSLNRSEASDAFLNQVVRELRDSKLEFLKLPSKIVTGEKEQLSGWGRILGMMGRKSPKPETDCRGYLSLSVSCVCLQKWVPDSLDEMDALLEMARVALADCKIPVNRHDLQAGQRRYHRSGVVARVAD